jgi:uncharacterized membrane protein
MERLEKYSYLVLTGYLILALFLVGSFLVKITNRQAGLMVVLPFLGWLVLSAYYLVRWSVRKVRPHPEAAKA